LSSPKEESKERSTTYEKVAKVVQIEMAGRGLKEKIMAGKRLEKYGGKMSLKNGGRINGGDNS
jgi:hypothetical protein